MADENVVTQNQNNKLNKNRKRKKNFLQNAKSFGKKGRYGRGSHLTEDVYQYFVNVLEMLKNDFETQDEKEIFVNNVLEQTSGEEVNYSRNQVGCRVIETLLPLAKDEILHKYYSAFNTDLRPLLSDEYASHVIQILVKLSAYKSVTTTDNKVSIEFTTKISKFLLNNLEDYVWDRYANHIIRTVLYSLAGIFDQQSKTSFKNVNKTELLDEYKDIVKEYAERLIQWPQFIDLPYENLTSGLLQALIESLKKVNSKLLKQIMKKLLDDSFLCQQSIETQLPAVFESQSAIHLLEIMIVNAKSKIFTQIYAKLFVNHLKTLSKMKETNFTVQKLLQYCVEKAEFEAIFDELVSELENINLSGYTGVILSLAQACKRLSAKQGPFLQQLMIALHCTDKNENVLVQLLLRMIPYERLEAVKNNQFVTNLHGTLIIQTLLEFNKPIKIVNSILDMNVVDLKQMFCDLRGCHIMDAYMNSIYVGEKSREKLIRKLQGTYQELASNKYGSRSFDAIWSKTSQQQKLHIMDELIYKEAGWSNTEFGKIIANKLNMQLFKRSKDQWLNSLNQVDKTKQLFSDIIDNVQKNLK